ncbi:MAG TPA: helix-turn-helix domain-containing protein, partial [Burkholderiales bacterium]|nr:helix-turn-helix domain-containing protein [Burkholderiales bacterium]
GRAASGGLATAAAPAVPMLIEETYHVARERLLAEFERRYLTWLVAQAGNNISRAARIAAVDRTTLYRLMERHGLQRIVSADPNGDGPNSHEVNEIGEHAVGR